MPPTDYDPILPPKYTSRSQDPILASSVPPKYSTIFGDPQERIPAGSKPTQHEFTLRSGVMMTGKPWLTMRIITRPSKLPHKLPRFFGGENVAGTVELKLDQPQNINSITLYLRGKMRTGFVDGTFYPFLEYSHSVWSKEAGDPRLENANPGKRFDGKLSGELELPFSFPFPTEVDITPRSTGKGKHPEREPTVAPTPQTFLERNLLANIEYELVLQITHGMLRSDSKLKTGVIFIPTITPSAPSERRQASYLNGVLLSGPDTDPDGWVALPKVNMRGITQQREIAVEYSLFLASPLCYTRGTVIPCYLLLSCLDHQVLDVIGDPKLQYIRLARHIRFFEDPGKGIEQSLQGKEPKTIEEFAEAELAVWWLPPKDVRQEPGLKRLEGEIHLEKDLVPSSEFRPFRVEYYVEILRIDGHIFEPFMKPNPSGQRTVLASQLVTIATCNAHGPASRPFTKRQRVSMAMRQWNDEFDNLHSLSANYGLALGPTQ